MNFSVSRIDAHTSTSLPPLPLLPGCKAEALAPAISSQDESPCNRESPMAMKRSCSPMPTRPCHPSLTIATYSSDLPPLTSTSITDPTFTELATFNATPRELITASNHSYISRETLKPPGVRSGAGSSTLDLSTRRIDPLLTRYIRLSYIGRGGFSTVWKSQEASTAALVALKESLVRSKSHYNLLCSEVSILKKLDHPGIIKVIEHSYTEPKFYTVLELGPLSPLSKAVGHLSLAEIKIIAAKLALILNYLETNSILHRDIKLDNILISRRGLTVRLIDFGFATELDKEHTTSGRMGSFSYMSPEIIDDKPYGFSSQWWAFGVCLYTLCFASHPFGRARHEFSDPNMWIKSIFSDLRSQAPLNFPKKHSLYSPQLEELLLSLLNHNPLERASFETIRHSTWFDADFPWKDLFTQQALKHDSRFLPSL